MNSFKSSSRRCAGLYDSIILLIVRLSPDAIPGGVGFNNVQENDPNLVRDNPAMIHGGPATSVQNTKQHTI